MLVENIRREVNSIVLKGVPAVSISGGIDSTIILHHVISDLMSGNNHEVCTYTAVFGDDEERHKARRVANFYGTKHTEIQITKDDILTILPIALSRYSFPRYNIWPWLVVDYLSRIGHTNLFIGEGANELFGYSDRTYLEGWAGQIVWVWPSWKIPCEEMNVTLYAPFRNLQEGFYPNLRWLMPPDKELLRHEYRNVLPDFVLKLRSTPPSISFYRMMSMSTDALQVEAARAWLETHN